MRGNAGELDIDHLLNIEESAPKLSFCAEVVA